MPRRPVPKPNHKQSHTEKVEGVWLLKALAAVFAVAAACVYLTLCFFFYRGQWQAVLHPVRAESTAPSANNLVRFAPDDSAQPQLTGEWLHAAPGARYAGLTVLFLPG